MLKALVTAALCLASANASDSQDSTIYTKQMNEEWGQWKDYNAILRKAIDDRDEKTAKEICEGKGIFLDLGGEQLNTFYGDARASALQTAIEENMHGLASCLINLGHDLNRKSAGFNGQSAFAFLCHPGVNENPDLIW